MHTRGRRVTLVSRVQRNPYVPLLGEGLQRAGWQVAFSDRFSLGWMVRQRRQVDVLHLHWLELFLIYPSWTRSLKRWLSVMLGLALARVVGVRLVYTVHNLAPHEGRGATLVRWGHRLMLAWADAVHVHDTETADHLARKWGRRRGVHVIAHGNYVTAYPHGLSRTEARQRLGLGAGTFVYLCLGRVRPYKGLEELVAAFRTLDAPEAALVVAGEVHDPGYEGRLQSLAAGDARIRLRLRFVADEDLQVYLGASDICVLPYRHVTTSGAALLAFSFGVPILAPRRGCFVSLVGEAGERGILYDPRAPEGLRTALDEAPRRDGDAWRAACARYAAQLDWLSLARQHATMYESVSRDASRDLPEEGPRP